MNVSLKEIQTFLKEKGYQPQIQEDTDQVYALFKINQVDFPFFVRIYEGAELVQLITFLPFKIEEKTSGDLARLLHLFNKELDIPGFGMDELSKIAFFRCMIPTKDGKFEPEIFENYLRATEFACKNFTPPIDAMITGEAKFDEVLEEAKKATRSETA